MLVYLSFLAPVYLHLLCLAGGTRFVLLGLFWAAANALKIS